MAFHNFGIKTLIYFLPLAIITGPFLSDLTISLISIFFISLSIIKKLKKYYLNIYSLTFFSWCLYIIINSFFSKNITLSLESSLFYIRFGIFSLSIWYAFENFDKLKKHFTLIFLCIYLFVVFDAYIQYIFGTNILGFKYSGGRVSGIFNNEFVLGSYLSRLFPFLLALVLMNFQNSKILTISTLLLLILVDILVFLSGERTAFFYLILSTLIIILFIKKWRILRISTFIISLFIISLISVNNSKVKDRMIDRSIEQITQHGNLNIFSIQHQAYYQSSFNIFMDHKIFGAGPKMFREYCKLEKYNFIPINDQSQNGCSTHPHNTYLQLLSEIGLVGVLPIILLLFFCFYYFFNKLIFYIKKFKLRKDNDLDDPVLTCLVLSILISLWPFVPTGSFFNNWLNIIYYLPIGVLFYHKTNIKKKIK